MILCHILDHQVFIIVQLWTRQILCKLDYQIHFNVSSKSWLLFYEFYQCNMPQRRWGVFVLFKFTYAYHIKTANYKREMLWILYNLFTFQVEINSILIQFPNYNYYISFASKFRWVFFPFHLKSVTWSNYKS